MEGGSEKRMEILRKGKEEERRVGVREQESEGRTWRRECEELVKK